MCAIADAKGVFATCRDCEACKTNCFFVKMSIKIQLAVAFPRKWYAFDIVSEGKSPPGDE